MRTINRRRFLSTATAGLSALAGVSDRTFAADRHDLIIKGGRVIDPSAGLDAIRDVAISQGRIAGVRANLAAEASDVIDARGKLVVPGLLDIHTHVGLLAESPGQVLKDGVTVWIDTDFEVMRKRVCTSNHRPLARDPERFAQLYEQRRPFYSRADYRVHVPFDASRQAMAELLALELLV